ncbi:nuclear transport factor 2 family protein [Nonomuraea sp. NPDC000554]|uniref:ester cyclase n=1 Tax=Nonomuraea sp. NPDC000554 TaxID=3154259 RepID=UPI00332F3775
MPSALDLQDQLFDAVNNHDLDRILECFSADAVYVAPIGVMEGHEQLTWYFEQLFAGFPDVSVTPWSRAAYEDSAVAECTVTGTQSGIFLLPDGRMLQPTGRRITIRCSCFTSAEHGKIISCRVYFDQLELFSQLGVDSLPGSRGAPPPASE